MPGPVVSLDHIRKEYRTAFTKRRKLAVQDISLAVPDGVIFGLLGPNGAGKTTTLKMMLGLVRPSSGDGTLLGMPLGDREAHRRLGFLPEEPYFYGFLTAEKGLDLYGKLLGLERDGRKQRAAELLDLVGLPADSHLTLGKYSKGMVQRFGIAQAMLNDPDLLIMDEPSSGLDPIGQKEVRDILIDLRSKGKTILLSSHQLSEVENVCDAVCIVSGGKSVMEGPLSSLLEVQGATEVVLEGGDIAARDELAKLADSVSEQDGRTTAITPEVDSYRLVDEARRLGFKLVSVNPYHRSLEDLFLEAVKGASR